MPELPLLAIRAYVDLKLTGQLPIPLWQMDERDANELRWLLLNTSLGDGDTGPSD